MRSSEKSGGLAYSPPSLSPPPYPCHTSENSLVGPTIATDPKSLLRKSFACHTSEPPRGALAPPPVGRSRVLPTYPLYFHILVHSIALAENSTLLFSSNSELFCKNTRGGGTGVHVVFLVQRDQRTKLRPMPVVGGCGNAHTAKFILIIFFVQDVPLLTAFQYFLFLRSDSLAHFQFDLLFVLQRGRQNLHHLLANRVAVVHEFHFLAFDKYLRDLVREPYDFFTSKAHRF